MFKWDVSGFNREGAQIYSIKFDFPIAFQGTGAAVASIYAVERNWTQATGSNTNPCLGETVKTGEPSWEYVESSTVAWSSNAGVTGPLLAQLSPLNNHPSDTFTIDVSTQGLSDIVRSWIVDPSTNFGIVIVPQNSTVYSGILFASPVLRIESNQVVPSTPPISPVNYASPIPGRRPGTLGGTVSTPTRYATTNSNAAIVGGVIGGAFALILIISIVTMILRGGSTTSTYRSSTYRSRSYGTRRFGRY